MADHWYMPLTLRNYFLVRYSRNDRFILELISKNLEWEPRIVSHFLSAYFMVFRMFIGITNFLVCHLQVRVSPGFPGKKRTAAVQRGMRGEGEVGEGGQRERGGGFPAFRSNNSWSNSRRNITTAEWGQTELSRAKPSSCRSSRGR